VPPEMWSHQNYELFARDVWIVMTAIANPGTFQSRSVLFRYSSSPLSGAPCQKADWKVNKTKSRDTNKRERRKGVITFSIVTGNSGNGNKHIPHVLQKVNNAVSAATSPCLANIVLLSCRATALDEVGASVNETAVNATSLDRCTAPN